MRTKPCYVCFFKDSLNKGAVTPILELDQGNVSTVALKLNDSLKKKTGFPVSFLQSKTNF